MLIRLRSLRTYAHPLTGQNYKNKQMHASILNTYKSAYSFFDDPDTVIYKKYLNSSEKQIRNFTEGKFKFERVIVPRNYIESQQFVKRLMQEWKDKKIVLNIDSSGLLGSKRFFMKNHLQQNVYKGLSQPEDVFCTKNPGTQLLVEQLKFDQNHFFSQDKAAKQIFKNTQNLQEDNRQQLLHQRLRELYQNQPQRFAHRLKNELNVPEQYCSIIQMSTYNENQIYFCGINQYAFRNLLSKYLSLEEVQKMFMLSLKFAEIQSHKYKIQNIQQYKGKIEQKYHIFGRQFIYLRHYKIIKRIQNGELVKRLSFISNKNVNQKEEDAKQQIEEQKKERVERMGRKSKKNIKKNANNKNNIVVFAHEYTLQTIQDFVLIQDLLSNADYQEVPDFSQKSQNSATPLQKLKQSGKKETDSQKIEKHAILEVMLGNLWSKHYTFNKFPYLSEDYNKLSQQDKKEVKKLFHQNLAKYTGAKHIYYQKNINKLDDIQPNSDQFTKIKQYYQKKKQQQQKQREEMNKKMLQKLQNQGKKHKIKQEKSEFQYQQSYEQQKQQKKEDKNRKKSKKQQLEQRDLKKLKQLQKYYSKNNPNQDNSEQMLKNESVRKKRRVRKYEKTKENEDPEQ